MPGRASSSSLSNEHRKSLLNCWRYALIFIVRAIQIISSIISNDIEIVVTENLKHKERNTNLFVLAKKGFCRFNENEKLRIRRLYDAYMLYFFVIGRTVPKMELIRKHLMIEGQIEKQCLIRILEEVTDIYRKWILSSAKERERMI